MRQELEDKGFHDALHTLVNQIATSLAVAFVAPEFLGHELIELVELAHKAHTVIEVYDLCREAADADQIQRELAQLLGGLDAAREFAAENDLPELRYMIGQEDCMVALERDFANAFERWQDAADAVTAYQAVLDQLRKRLQAAADALYDCLARNAGQPCPSGNPNGGAGICH